MSSRATSVRPPYITIRSSRARANSYIPPLHSPAVEDFDLLPTDDPAGCSPVVETTEHTTPFRSALDYLSSFFVHRSTEHMYSLSHSASSSVDSLSLPLPASPQQASFGAEVWQEDGHFRIGGRPTTKETVPWWSGGVSAYFPMLLILLLFPLSTMLVIGGLYSLPIQSSFPRTLGDLAELARELQAYSESGHRPMLHVLGVLSITSLWKHAWSIPGSVLLNVLCGVLLSPVLGTLLMTFLTALGSVFSSLLATPLAPVMSQWFPRALNLTRTALEGGNTDSATKEKTPVWVRLSVLRLIGVVPWSGINIACGVTGVPLFDCFLGAFIGTLPWTAVTCQIGDIMQTFAQTKSPSSSETLSSLVRSPNVIFKLVILSVISLVPILVRDRLKGLVSRSDSPSEIEAVAEVKDASGKRWWYRHWRTRSREGIEVVSLAPLSEKAILAQS